MPELLIATFGENGALAMMVSNSTSRVVEGVRLSIQLVQGMLSPLDFYMALFPQWTYRPVLK